MITATKQLNRGQTRAIATFNGTAWSVRIEGKCHRGNQPTIEAGWEQILNQQLAENDTLEGSLEGTGFELDEEENPECHH